MVLVLVAAIAIFWWRVSDPAGGGEAGATPPTLGAERPPGRQPPADLRGGEAWFADLTLDAGTLVTAGSMLRDVRAVGQDVLTNPDGLIAARDRPTHGLDEAIRVCDQRTSNDSNRTTERLLQQDAR